MTDARTESRWDNQRDLRKHDRRASDPRRALLPAGQCAYCDSHRADGMKPPHDASWRCESGQRDHCTCDTCF